MARRTKSGPARPTAAELEILRILWRLGPSTVRAIHEALTTGGGCAQQRPIGYTTVLKLLQIMLDKGMVLRDDSSRAHIYAPAECKETTQRRLLADFLDDVFEGSTAELMLQALEIAQPQPAAEEVGRIRARLDRLESRQ